MHQSIRRLLNLIFPIACTVCKKSGVLICIDCIEALPRAHKPAIDAEAALRYSNRTVKNAIWSLKYRGNKEYSAIFGTLLYNVLAKHTKRSILSVEHEVVLIPIPLTGKRKRKRGFNQSELIARELAAQARTHGVKMRVSNNTLIKTSDTPSQARSHNKRERLRNLRGTFAVKDPAHLHKKMIIVDDVITTGATIDEARRTLRKAGARDIHAIAVAH